MKTNIILAGVGGQGILTIAAVLDTAALSCELNIKQSEITITTGYKEGEVNLHIDDIGPGIDEDKIDSIFLPLATWKSGGTGMGLAISNSIIESHGGMMYAENLSGGGARVGFTIPIIDKN